MHQAQREQRGGSRMDRQKLVGKRGRAGFVRIDTDQPRTLPAGLLDERPQVDVVAVHVGAPADDEPGVGKILRLRAALLPVDPQQRLAARGRADGPVQLRRAQPMEEAPIHRAVAQLPDGTRVAVRQHTLRTPLGGDGPQPRGDLGQSFVPRNALEGGELLPAPERPLGHAGAAPHGIEQAVGRVDMIEVARYLAAQKATRDGMRGIARELHRALTPVRAGRHRHQHTAAVRAVERADCVYGLRVCLHCAPRAALLF